jgi:hypothetical protein
MNVTTDQTLTADAVTGPYAINAIYVTNASTSLTTAAGGIYTGGGKTGTILVADTQVYSALTSSTKLLNTTLTSAATQNTFTGPPIFSLTTRQGATATADIYVLGSELNAGGGSSAPVLDPNGAQWISPSTATISTLEAGQLFNINAWGGTEYGYSYTFTLSGAPAGVTIDSDTGYFNVASSLSVGIYNFSVIATNIIQNTVSNAFQFTLTVLVATTTIPPSASQIAHKTYDPGSGTWGTPTGSDWTSVLNAMQTAILSDQTACNAVRDGSLRVDVPFQRGTTYNYTNNGWATGIQYLNIHDAGSGALPILCCNVVSGVQTDAQFGPLNTGLQVITPGNVQYVTGALAFQSGGMKAHMATIATTAVGDTTVTLLNSGDTSKIAVGRWHIICSANIQIGGYPPNCAWVEYAKVTAVSGTTITLDRPLKYIHRQDNWESTTDDESLGVARIVPYDMGGQSGPAATFVRPMQRLVASNINFVANPNHVTDTNLFPIGIDMQFIGCTLVSPSPTMSKNILWQNCNWVTKVPELDKLVEIVVIDGCNVSPLGNTAELQGGTGVEYVMIRGSHVGSINLGARQFRAIGGSNIDATGDTIEFVPIASFQAYGPIMSWAFNGSTVQAENASPSNYWIYPQNPSGNSAYTLGTDCSWGTGTPPATTLVFPVGGSNSKFERALSSYEGIVIDGNGNSGNTPISTNWGYVTKIYSPGDGTAMWMDVTWVNGSKPTSGTIHLHRWRSLAFTSMTFGSANHGTIWADAGFFKTNAPGNATYGFPAGLPAPYNYP